MQRRHVLPLSLLAVVLLISACNLQDHTPAPEPIFDLHRLSDRVLVLTERSPMENNIIVLAARDGLVVVDSSGSPVTAAAARRIIAKEFERSDFRYLVNTHWHWDHAWGNQAFPEATVVGHEECVARMIGLSEGMPRRAADLRAQNEDLSTRLPQLDPESEEARRIRLRLAFNSRNYRGIEQDFIARPPTVTFSDRMTLDLGDLTLQMVFFGRAHSGADILILVPEEELLLTGDLFLEKNWLPLVCGMPQLDVDRWFQSLELVLDGEAAVRRVVPGHIDIWDKEKLVGWRDYFVKLWDGVKNAEERSQSLPTVLERLKLPERFDYLKARGHTDEELARFHERNIRSFWAQFKENAADIIAAVLEESGIQAADARFEAMRAAQGNDYHFDERAFNLLGYRLMGESELPRAITVFKMNVELFPGSWNVYDSLAEAQMAVGERERAIANYRRSLELNPQNENGRRMLEQLEAD